MLHINDLWDSRDERKWLVALALAVRKDPGLVQFIRTVDLDYVRGLGVQEWYDFLTSYFHWQFAGNHLQQKLKSRPQQF